MNNGDTRDAGAQLLSVEQAATIVMLMQRIGIEADSSGMLEAQRRVGGAPTAHGYLLLSRVQAHSLIGLMAAYVRTLERPDERGDTGAGVVA